MTEQPTLKKRPGVYLSKTALGILSSLLVVVIVTVSGAFLAQGNELTRLTLLVGQHEEQLELVVPAVARLAAQHDEILRRLDRIQNLSHPPEP